MILRVDDADTHHGQVREHKLANKQVHDIQRQLVNLRLKLRLSDSSTWNEVLSEDADQLS